MPRYSGRGRGATPVRKATPTIEVDPNAHLTVYDYVGLKEYIASQFDGPVDVVDRDGLKPYVRPAATADAVRATLATRYSLPHRPRRGIRGGV